MVDNENSESMETVVDGGKPGVRFQRQGETCWKERSEDKDLYYFSYFSVSSHIHEFCCHNPLLK